MCIPTALPLVYADLHGSALQKRQSFKIALVFAFTVSLLLYSVMSYSTAIGFGRFTQDSVLKTFDGCGFKWMDFIQIVYGVVSILRYPLVMQIGRVSLL